MLYQVLEENSIYWNDDIEFVLSMNIKTVEKLKETSERMALMKLYKNDDDRRFATDLFCKTVLNHDANNTIIRSTIKNWDLERLAQMDLLIIEMAMSEITSFESIPVKVSLNEYIDLAKFYSTDRSNAFVNGIHRACRYPFRKRWWPQSRQSPPSETCPDWPSAPTTQVLRDTVRPLFR